MALAERTTEPRKRPRQKRSQVTVDAILEATARVLRAEGYGKASTNRIAKVAGVSVGSLYQYFPNKDALVTALVEQHVNEMLAVLSQGLTELADAPMEQVARELVGKMIEVHAVDPALHIVLTEQIPRGDKLPCVGAEIEHAATLLRAFLELRRDELRAKDLDMAVFIIVHTVEALTHRAVVEHPETLADGKLEDEIVDLLVRYMVP
jgi:AcrR family transcriptional regulator